MSTTTIPTYRYQYRPSFSQPSGFSFSVSPPRNTLPHHHLESPTNIFLQASNSSEDKLIVRQVGGPGDNHVQWVSKSDIIPIPYPDNDEEFSSFSSSSADFGESRVRAGNSQANSSDGNGAGDGDGRKRRTKTLKSYPSQVHGIVHTANWANDVGDRLWLRSDQPIIKGRRSVPVVNLDKGVSGEVCISSVTWYPPKRELSTNALITFIGAEYRQQRRGGGDGRGPFRMCITQKGENGEGIIEMLSLEELGTCFEDVKSKSLPQQPTIPRQNETHGMITSSLAKEPAVFGEEGNSRNLDTDNNDDDDDDDDNLSHASFASSAKGKVALDLVARSLSIFNFNAAMLDLAALSNQSMGMGMGMDGFIGNAVNEPPEASDESDEEDEDEEEGKVWSDCESHYSGGQSVMEDEDEDTSKYERSRVEDSGSGGDV